MKHVLVDPPLADNCSPATCTAVPHQHAPLLCSFCNHKGNSSTLYRTTSHLHRVIIASMPSTASTYLELHLVRLLAVSQAEARLQIAGKEFFVLDGGEYGLVDGLLV
jgi:hypothetical protein